MLTAVRKTVRSDVENAHDMRMGHIEPGNCGAAAHQTEPDLFWQ